MYIQKIHIENFRLLKDVDIVLDKSITLVVGKNNTGKTSIAYLLQSIINEKKNLSFNDYPLECRKQLYEALEKYWAGQLKNTEIKNQIEETKVIFISIIVKMERINALESCVTLSLIWMIH